MCSWRVAKRNLLFLIFIAVAALVRSIIFYAVKTRKKKMCTRFGWCCSCCSCCTSHLLNLLRVFDRKNGILMCDCVWHSLLFVVFNIAFVCLLAQWHKDVSRTNQKTGREKQRKRGTKIVYTLYIFNHIPNQFDIGGCFFSICIFVSRYFGYAKLNVKCIENAISLC